MFQRIMVLPCAFDLSLCVFTLKRLNRCHYSLSLSLSLSFSGFYIFLKRIVSSFELRMEYMYIFELTLCVVCCVQPMHQTQLYIDALCENFEATQIKIIIKMLQCSV